MSRKTSRSRVFVLKLSYRYHYSEVIKRTMESQFTGVSIVCTTVCSGADQEKYQSSASLAFVRRIHRWPANFPHKGPVTRKMFPFDDVIVCYFARGGGGCQHFRAMGKLFTAISRDLTITRLMLYWNVILALCHYDDVTRASWHLKSPAMQLFV